VSGENEAASGAAGGGEELVAVWAAAPLAAAEILALAGEGVRSEHTRRAYTAGFRALAAFLGVPDERAALNTLLAAGSRGAQALVLRFRQSLVARELAPATINLRLAALASAVRLARLSGTVDWDLLLPRVRHSGARRESRGPEVADVRRLLAAAAAQENEEKAVRDVALLHLLYDLGLRRSEVVGLDAGDVDLERQTAAVARKGGGGARVLLELPEPTATAIAAWLAVRGAAPGPLFVELSRRGDRGRLAAGGLYFVVRRLGEEVGVRARPHGLRHASITSVLRLAADRGVPLPEVFAATGHAPASVGVVLGYYDRGRSRQGELARAVAATVAA
jgi:integrase/recombinase XerC